MILYPPQFANTKSDLCRTTRGSRPVPTWTAITAMSVVVVALIVALLFQSSFVILERVPMPLKPGRLTGEAQKMLKETGHDPTTTTVEDHATGYGYESSYLLHVLKTSLEKDRFSYLRQELPATIFFWYRQSPARLTPTTWKSPEYRWRLIYPDDPPLTLPGMITVKLNPQGKLIELRAVPDPKWKGTLNGETWWKVLDLERTGLNLTPEHELTEQLSLATPHDDSRVWITNAPGSKIAMRVEAAVYRGRLVHYKAAPEGVPIGGMSSGNEMRYLAVWIVLVALSFLAVQNLRSGRADLRGARRVMLFLFATWFFTFILQANHRPSLLHEHQLLMRDISFFLYQATYFLVAYIAVESYARRYWSNSLRTWFHVLDGRFREPLVGRDLLFGTALGVSVVALQHVTLALFNLSGGPEPLPSAMKHLHALMGSGALIGTISNDLYHVTLHTWIMLAFFLLLRVVLRKKWVAGMVFLVFWTVLTMGAAFPHPELYGRVPASWVQVALIVGAIQLAVTRLGFVAAIVTLFVIWLLTGSPITTDLERWYVDGGLLVLGLIVGMAVYGFTLIRSNATARPTLSTGTSRWSL